VLQAIWESPANHASYIVQKQLLVQRHHQEKYLAHVCKATQEADVSRAIATIKKMHDFI